MLLKIIKKILIFNNLFFFGLKFIFFINKSEKILFFLKNDNKKK